MKRPESGAADDPREWLRRARSNLTRAKTGVDIPEVFFEDLCFDAQQAAEKALKAVLIHWNIRFPYTHDLAELLTLVENKGGSVPPGVREAGHLTPFAAELRYPGFEREVTRDRYEQLVAIAEAVVRWAEERIS